MKRYVSVLLAVLMLLLAGCQPSRWPQTTANLEQNDPSTVPTTILPTTQTTQPQEDYILAPAPLYAQKQKELEDAWVAAGNAPLEGWYIKGDPDTVFGSFYLGNFDGCDVLYIRHGNGITYDSYIVYAYKNGELLELGRQLLGWWDRDDEKLISEENAKTARSLAHETWIEVEHLYLDSQQIIYGPAPLELEKRQEIEAVMKEMFPKWTRPIFTSIVDGQIVCSGLVYYGCFDGCDVFFDPGMMDSVDYQRYGNAVFEYTSTFVLYAYKDGKLNFMQYAYPDGWISDEGIEQAAQVHREYMEQYEPDRIPSEEE